MPLLYQIKPKTSPLKSYIFSLTKYNFSSNTTYAKHVTIAASMSSKRQVLVMITPLSRLRIDGIVRYARQHDWALSFHDRLGGLMPSFKYDGILVTLRADMTMRAYIRAARRRKIPIVDLTIQHPRIRLHRVISDHVAIGQMAGEHFREHGFTNAAWYSTGWTHVHNLRFEGFASTLGFTPARWVTDSELESRATLLRATRPIGVLAYDETDAVRLLNLCTACGLSVPDDIAILSIGDDPLITDNQSVPISCIRQNMVQGGFAAAELLGRLMNGESILYDPILISPDGITIRRSTDTLADDDPLIRQALLYIRDNLHRPFGSAQIAEALGISRSRLDKAFTAKFKCSIGCEILHRRLEKAKLLLCERTLNVNQVAAECGFCASSYFIRKFKATTDLTPFQWQRQQSQPTPLNFSTSAARDR